MHSRNRHRSSFIEAAITAGIAALVVAGLAPSVGVACDVVPVGTTPVNVPIDIAISGNHAYTILNNDGLRIIDVSSPQQPTVVGSVNTGGYAQDVALAGGLAFVANGYGGLRIVNVSDPTDPNLLGDCCGEHHNFQHVAVSGHFAYVAAAEDGIRVVDFSNPADPIETGYWNTQDLLASAVFASGQYLYCAGHYALHVLDISIPSAPVEVGRLDSTTAVSNWVFVAGDYAYVIDGSTLMIVDVSNPADPTEVGSIYRPYGVFDVAVVGHSVLIAEGQYGGLRIIDASSPSNPVEVGHYEGLTTYRVAGSGAFAYTGTSYDFDVFDVGDCLGHLFSDGFGSGDTDAWAAWVD